MAEIRRRRAIEPGYPEPGVEDSGSIPPGGFKISHGYRTPVQPGANIQDIYNGASIVPKYPGAYTSSLQSSHREAGILFDKAAVSVSAKANKPQEPRGWDQNTTLLMRELYPELRQLRARILPESYRKKHPVPKELKYFKHPLAPGSNILDNPGLDPQIFIAKHGKEALRLLFEANNSHLIKRARRKASQKLAQNYGVSAKKIAEFEGKLRKPMPGYS